MKEYHNPDVERVWRYYWSCFLLCFLFLLCSWTYKHAKTPWRWFSRSLRLGNAPGISKKIRISHFSAMKGAIFLGAGSIFRNSIWMKRRNPSNFEVCTPRWSNFFGGRLLIHDHSWSVNHTLQVPLLTGACWRVVYVDWSNRSWRKQPYHRQFITKRDYRWNLKYSETHFSMWGVYKMSKIQGYL